MKKLFTFYLLLFTFSLSPSSAQTAAELDTMLKTEAITAAAAARFVLATVELLPQGLTGNEAETAAWNIALEKGWVRGRPEEAISLQNTAFLLMSVFELKGGLMFSLARNPRYAYREMIYRRLIQGRSYSHMEVSGERFLQILGSTLNYTGERERTDALLLSSEEVR